MNEGTLMTGRLSLLKSTFVGGVMFLAPLTVLGIIAVKVHALAKQIVAPLAAHLPADFIVGMSMPGLLAAVLIVIVCCLAGLVARMGPARRLVGWMEGAILGNLPGYALMKGIGENLIGAADENKLPVVLARIEDAWQLGFLMERVGDKHFAVFVPDAPSPWSGSLYYMTEDRIRPAGVTLAQALKCIRHAGLGSSELLRAQLESSETPGHLHN